MDNPNERGWTPKKRLEGKVALVIGAGQSAGEGLGNGRATALRFAREGARVAAANRHIESVAETVDMIKAEGGEAFALRTDVTVEQDIVDAVKATMDKWGRIDILHYNVGVSLGLGDTNVIEITETAFDNIYKTNLRGAAFACKHVLPIMREQRSGAIVNVSSATAVGLSPFVAYKASKAAMNAMTEQLALQNAPYNIRVNAIMPGLIDTPMAVQTRVEKLSVPREQLLAERAAKVPLGRRGTAWDVADLALFLASEEASFITGECILVDGGRILNRT